MSHTSHPAVLSTFDKTQLAGVKLVLVTATVRAEKGMHNPCDCACLGARSVAALRLARPRDY